MAQGLHSCHLEVHEALSTGWVVMAREGTGASASMQGGTDSGHLPRDKKDGEKAEIRRRPQTSLAPLAVTRHLGCRSRTNS